MYSYIYTYFVKKRESYKLFRLRMKILWEPGSKVPRHYPTLPELGKAVLTTLYAHFKEIVIFAFVVKYDK